MGRLNRLLMVTALTFTATAALATPPSMLVTHNTTDLDSNAFIEGTIPSNHPTRAHSDNRVSWLAVKMACFGHTQANKCPALIKVGTNTASPIDIGMVVMDLMTGDISPKQLSANGYTLIVNGPGETTLIKD